MKRLRRIAVFGLAGAGALALGGCRLAFREARREAVVERHGEAQVVAALARYRQLIIDGDAIRLADMFDAAGELWHNDAKPITGHDAILAFMNGFAGYKVQAYELRATVTTMRGNTATQVGTYQQTARTPDGQTLNVQGSFDAEWLHQADGRWLLRRMHTTSPANA